MNYRNKVMEEYVKKYDEFDIDDQLNEMSQLVKRKDQHKFPFEVWIYGKEHNPPHFHLIYKNVTYLINIETLDHLSMSKSVPSKLWKLTKQWMKLKKYPTVTFYEHVQETWNENNSQNPELEIKEILKPWW